VIHNASVVHSCDHASLHKMINSVPVPFILRVPPPMSKTHKVELPASLADSFRALFHFSARSDATPKDFRPDDPVSPWTDDAAILCHPEDLESTCWADLLFYRAHNSTLLIDCQYELTDPRAVAAVERYRAALRDVSRRTRAIVDAHSLPWIDPEDSPEYPAGGSDDAKEKFRARHCIGAGIQY